MNLRLSNIRLDKDLQVREKMHDDVISEYYDVLRNGGKLPPVVVFFDKTAYYLADGNHRYHAHKTAGMETIEVEIKEGSKRDAQLYAFGANHDHGLRRTQADKRKAIEIMLNDIEWVEWSDREISKICKVSHVLVAKVRKELGANADNRRMANGSTQPAKKGKNEDKTSPRDEGSNEEFRIAELSDALVQAEEEKTALADRLALKVVNATEEEKARLGETLTELRQQIKVLEAENRSLKASLKVEVEEKNQLIKQVNYWKKQATKGTK